MATNLTIILLQLLVTNKMVCYTLTESLFGSLAMSHYIIFADQKIRFTKLTIRIPVSFRATHSTFQLFMNLPDLDDSCKRT